MLLQQLLTGSQGGSLGSKMEVEGEEGEAAATCISVHLLAVAACGGMAEEKHKCLLNNLISQQNSGIEKAIFFSTNRK